MSPPRFPVDVGDVITIDEADYCYGTGVLVRRVTEVQQLQRYEDGLWLNVSGVHLCDDDTEPHSPYGQQAPDRYALVRLTALTPPPPPRKVRP